MPMLELRLRISVSKLRKALRRHVLIVLLPVPGFPVFRNLVSSNLSVGSSALITGMSSMGLVSPPPSMFDLMAIGNVPTLLVPIVILFVGSAMIRL